MGVYKITTPSHYTHVHCILGSSSSRACTNIEYRAIAPYVRASIAAWMQFTVNASIKSADETATFGDLEDPYIPASIKSTEQTYCGIWGFEGIFWKEK